MKVSLHRGHFHEPGPRGVHHGPQSWPWWRVWPVLSVVRLGRVYSPTKGWRLWIYTRWFAWYIDLYVKHPRWQMICGECRKAMYYDSEAWRCDCGTIVFPTEAKK